MPLAAAAASWLFHIRYPQGEYGLLVLAGSGTGLALRLIAREREHYRAAALGRSSDLEALRSLSWQDFEIVVGELVRRQNYLVKERGGFQADGGVDMIAEGRGGRIVIQCKQWRSRAVSESQVKELYATVKAERFREGWLVTCGHFTDNAKGWAKGKELRLIDGTALVDLLGGRFPVQVTTGASGSPLATTAAAVQSLPAAANPQCPECGRLMRRQTNSTDQSLFWGCTGFPDCRFTAEDPPVTTERVTCPRGHPMTLRTTYRGTAFWGCSTYPTCHRKRLAAAP
jgi:restriction system protein